MTGAPALTLLTRQLSENLTHSRRRFRRDFKNQNNINMLRNLAKLARLLLDIRHDRYHAIIKSGEIVP
ncbi:MAG: hypothetical protein ACRCUI_00160 [Polymorphobacter sp.]